MLGVSPGRIGRVGATVRLIDGVVTTVLLREYDGTVTVQSLGPTWQPSLTRQPDGTVTVGA